MFPYEELKLTEGSLSDTVDKYGTLIVLLIKNFWVFIVFSAISRIPDYINALKSNIGKMMIMPYANVVRMHIMIFVFAGLAIAGLHNYALYPILLFYFFPFRSVMELLKGRKASKA